MFADFDNKQWRTFLSLACKETDVAGVGATIISPFGFELLEDKSFLRKPLRKFYCYIGIPKKNTVPTEIFAEKFYETMMTLPEYESQKHLKDLVIIVINKKFMKFRKTFDILGDESRILDIQCRIVDTDILEDYANYIICSLEALSSEKDEPRHFFTNKRHRIRTYQLYIMLESIFENITSPFTFEEKTLYKKIFSRIDNKISLFFDDDELYTTASPLDVEVMEKLIKPRLKEMKEKTTNSVKNRNISVACDGYHLSGRLKVSIDKEIYKNAVKKIKKTYLAYI